MFPTNGHSIHKGIPLTLTCGVHWLVRHPRHGFEFYRAPILPPKPKPIARNVPPTPRAKGPLEPATPSLQGICENLPQLPTSMARSPDLPPLRRIPSHRLCYNIDDAERIGAASPSTTLLALLKYPFYPLFILDNGMNLISKSLTVLTPA